MIEAVSKGRNALHPITAYQVDTAYYEQNYKPKAVDRSSTSQPASADHVDISRPATALGGTGTAPFKTESVISDGDLRGDAPVIDNSTLTHEAENVKNAPDAESPVGAAECGVDPYTALQNEFGTVPSGEHPVRPDDVPVSTDGTDRVSLTARTAIGAKATPDSRVGTVERVVVDGELSHIPGTNRVQVRRARARIRNKGFDKALQDWTKAVNGGEVNADLVAEGAILLNNAGNSDMPDSEYTHILITY